MPHFYFPNAFQNLSMATTHKNLQLEKFHCKDFKITLAIFSQTQAVSAKSLCFEKKSKEKERKI